MAVYSGAYERSCCNSSTFGPHEESCRQSPYHYTWALAQELGGFALVYKHTTGRTQRAVKYIRCLRGCGCLVWDMRAHVENVCTTWDRGSE